jgi:hypothetical protein
MMSRWTGQGRFPAGLPHEHAGVIARLVAAVLAARVADPMTKAAGTLPFRAPVCPVPIGAAVRYLRSDGFRP